MIPQPDLFKNRNYSEITWLNYNVAIVFDVDDLFGAGCCPLITDFKIISSCLNLIFEEGYNGYLIGLDSLGYLLCIEYHNENELIKN